MPDEPVAGSPADKQAQDGCEQLAGNSYTDYDHDCEVVPLATAQRILKAAVALAVRDSLQEVLA